MEDQKSSEGNTNTSNSSPSGSLLSKSQEKEQKTICVNSETNDSDRNARGAPNVLAFENTIRKGWAYVRTPDFQGPAIAIGTLVIACFTFATWVVILTGSKDTERAAKAAESFSKTATLVRGDLQQAVSDNKQALSDNNQAIRNTLAENRTELAKVLDQNRQSLDAGIAQGKKALDASIESSHLDQRPWIYISKYVLSNEPEDGKDFTVTIGIFNSGKTPALDAIPMSQMFVYNTEPPDTDFTTAPKAKSQAIVPPGVTEISTSTDALKITGPSLPATIAE